MVANALAYLHSTEKGFVTLFAAKKSFFEAAKIFPTKFFFPRLKKVVCISVDIQKTF
jgi:hypothetical protein